jgi:tripartite-type tricarboxylate transporter receptor subunit TctC
LIPPGAVLINGYGRASAGATSPICGCNQVAARLIGQWLSDRLRQPFIIENRPGAATNIATEALRFWPPFRQIRSTRRSTPNSVSILRGRFILEIKTYFL